MKLWELKQSDVPKTVDLYIYSDIAADGYDWWEDKKIESETSANHFRDELAKIGEIDNINIYINSLGGSVMEGVAIYNQLKRHKAHKTVYIDGFACSIASVIAMAGDEIIMPRNTTMMIHNAWTYTAGNAQELRKTADDLDVINESSRQAYLMKAGEKLPEEKLIEMLNAETYLTAMQCVEYGLADQFAENDADMDKAKQALQQVRQQAVPPPRFAAKTTPPKPEPNSVQSTPENGSTGQKQYAPAAALTIMSAYLKSIKNEESKK